MRLEIPEVLEWLASYSFVNPEFAVHRWLERYELSWAEYLRQVPYLLRVEIPELHDESIASNIRALIKDRQD